MNGVKEHLVFRLISIGLTVKLFKVLEKPAMVDQTWITKSSKKCVLQRLKC